MGLITLGVGILHKLGTGLLIVDATLLVLVFASSALFSWTVPRADVTISGGTSTAVTTSGGAGAAPTPTIDVWNPPEGW
jgi:hypothetical protein